jgi:hypothetical protein
MPDCIYCHEPVLPKEESPIGPLGAHLHHECSFRSIIGSVAHIEQRCSCYVDGSTESDPPAMSLREGARAALSAYQRLHDPEVA